MSHISAPPEFNFWEFVSCGICQLEYIDESGALSNVPFWLTECGHVVCNKHLNADQSCAECGSTGIHVLAMARDLEPPMANWFESTPAAFDAVGYALRFQLNTMASLVRFYKKKYLQYRPLYERLKEEHTEAKRLRKLVDDLRSENQGLMQHLQGLGGDLGDNFAGRKRRRIDNESHYGAQRTSSPRSVASLSTPVGPNRLTLPPNHHQPSFNSRQPHRTHEPPAPQRNLSQYAYAPPLSAQGQNKMTAPVLSYIQSGSSRRAQVREDATVQYDQQTMPPPPLPGTWSTTTRAQTRTSRTEDTPKHLPQRPSFRPPATPQAASSSSSQRFIPQTPSRATNHTPAATPRTGPHLKSQSQIQRFIPSGAPRPVPGSHSTASLATTGTTTSAPRPLAATTPGPGGQRAPFIPGTPASFS
ncbi:hypothetical protein LXA43DRAFT_990016 [Ganoderma leucocontextum]|nr:hypothetical protein LXA43DRAFT_990016 [Ganoderma leucocontextum]